MKKDNFRVLHIFSGYGGGISSLILNLIENKTDNFAFDIMAFSFANGELFIQRLEKMGTHCLTMPRPRIDGYSKFKNYVNDVMKKGQYDAVHCHIAGWSAFPFYKLAKKNGVKSFIIHAHTTTYDRRLDRIKLINSIDKYLNYKMATEYMTCSDMAADYIFGANYLQKKKCTLIPNGIKEELFDIQLSEREREAFYQEFNLDRTWNVIGHVGRFNAQKNHSFILELAKNLCEIKSKYVLLLVGTGEDFENIKEQAEVLGLQDYVRFLGRRNDISKIMQFVDGMILPSLYEGLPTVAIESQASGTPIILANTITKQCDMQMGLAKFLPLNDVKEWIRAIENISEHKSIEYCIDKIKKNSFTAYEAGKLYCNSLSRIILSNP